MSPEQEELELASKAFNLMPLATKKAVLQEFAALRYPSVVDRFHEAVYRVIKRETTAP